MSIPAFPAFRPQHLDHCPPSAQNHSSASCPTPSTQGGRVGGVGRMARRSPLAPRRAGAQNRSIVSAACAPTPVLNPVSRVVPNPVLAAGRPTGHPKTIRPRWPPGTSARAPSSWSTWTRRHLVESRAIHVNQLRSEPRRPATSGPRRAALVHVDQSGPPSATATKRDQIASMSEPAGREADLTT